MNQNPHDHYAHRYEEIYQRSFGKMYDRLTENHFEFLKNLLNQQQYHNVIDIGCGTGRLAIRFAKEGIQTTAIEPSLGMYNQLQNRIRDEVSDHSFIDCFNCFVQDFKPERKYNLAFSLFTVLNYITSDDEMLKYFNSIFNLLSDEGCLIVDFAADIKVYNNQSIQKTDFKRNIYINQEPAIPNGFNYSEHTIIDGESFEIEIPLRQWDKNEIKQFAFEAGFKNEPQLQDNLTLYHHGLIWHK